MDHKIKKIFEHIWQPGEGLVISSQPFLLPIRNSIKMKLNFQRIFDNPLSKLPSRDILGQIGYVSSYLPQLEYVQWVTNSTPDLKTPSLKPTDVLGWVLGSNPTTRLLLIKYCKYLNLVHTLIQCALPTFPEIQKKKKYSKCVRTYSSCFTKVCNKQNTQYSKTILIYC